MDRNTPPPVPRQRLTRVDIALLLGVVAFIAYAFYRVNDVLEYHWNWGRVFNYVVRFDEETSSWVPNILLEGLAMTLRLAIWGTVLATVVGVVMGY